MPTHPFEFRNHEKTLLSGSLEMPEGIQRGWALFAHCFTCGKSNLAAVRISRTLASVGIGVLRFDFAGLGGSGGKFTDTSFTQNVRDLVSAADAMEAAGMPPSLLVGHSLGGSAILAAAGRIASALAIVSIAAPYDVAHVLHLLDQEGLARLKSEGQPIVQVRGLKVSVGKAFVQDSTQHDLGPLIAELRRPLLLLHAPDDQVVGLVNATRIFKAAQHPKSFISLDNADHLLSRRQDAEHVAHTIATWAGRYLPEPSEDHPVIADAEAEETGLGKFQLALRSGGSRWLADEPATVGGMGSGPTPYNLLSSALAACTTMTLRHFADSKGWPVTRIRTAVSHSKEKSYALPDVFSRRVVIEGSVTEEQRAQLLAVAQRCPVHRTLERGARFDPVQVEPRTDLGLKLNT